MRTEDIRVVLFVLALGFVAWSARRAGGKLAPRATIAPLVFLATRMPVLVAWLLGTLGMVALLLPGARAHGHDSIADFAIMAGLSVFCGLGYALLMVGPVFFVARAFAAKPTLTLESGEIVLCEVAANHFLRGEARGGRLLVTNRRVGFRPHRFNVQLGTWSARLEDVTTVGHEGERFLLVDTTTDSGTQWLVVYGAARRQEQLRRVAELPEAERVEPFDAACRRDISPGSRAPSRA